MMFTITNSKNISSVLLKLHCFANCIAKIGLGDSELEMMSLHSLCQWLKGLNTHSAQKSAYPRGSGRN